MPQTVRYDEHISVPLLAELCGKHEPGTRIKLIRHLTLFNPRAWDRVAAP